MLKNVAMIVGIIFLAVGVLGFVPALAPDGKLLAIFAVNAAHNVVHLLVGILGILSASGGWSKKYLQAWVLCISSLESWALSPAL